MNATGHFNNSTIIINVLFTLAKTSKLIICLTIILPYARTKTLNINIAIKSIIMKNAFVLLLKNGACSIPNSSFDVTINELVPFDIK